MMNFFLILFFLSSVALVPGFQCQKNTAAKNCYKGRLEIKGICMNYTIKVLEGSIDTALIAPIWKDESTGIEHQNVFKLESICNFPAGIKQGEEFYFTIDKAPKKEDCIVCMAYYPTPEKGLTIRVLDKACN